MFTQITTLQGALVRAACGLLFLLAVGLAGCGGNGSGSTPVSAGPDRSADFGLLIDPVSKNALVKPGQTIPLTLDLVSANGFPNPITLSADKVPTGWTTTFAMPTVSSLPKGITKVVVNVTVPVGASPVLSFSVGQIKATGGGTTRYLDSGYVPNLTEAGDPPIGQLLVSVAGVSLTTYEPYPFYVPATNLTLVAFRSGDVTGRVALYAVGLTGPVTIALTNSNPGLTAVLPQSTFTPTNGAINVNVPINVHADASVPSGFYPLTVTATTPGYPPMTVTTSVSVAP